MMGEGPGRRLAYGGSKNQVIVSLEGPNSYGFGDKTGHDKEDHSDHHDVAGNNHVGAMIGGGDLSISGSHLPDRCSLFPAGQLVRGIETDMKALSALSV